MANEAVTVNLCRIQEPKRAMNEEKENSLVHCENVSVQQFFSFVVQARPHVGLSRVFHIVVQTRQYKNEDGNFNLYAMCVSSQRRNCS